MVKKTKDRKTRKRKKRRKWKRNGRCKGHIKGGKTGKIRKEKENKGKK